MNAHKRSLGQIFDPSIRLVVPLFQRPYVWRQERNWEPLWESIQEVAELRLNEKTRTHFLGAVVLDQLKTRTGDIDSRQIIDGQRSGQRTRPTCLCASSLTSAMTVQRPCGTIYW